MFRLANELSIENAIENATEDVKPRIELQESNELCSHKSCLIRYYNNNKTTIICNTCRKYVCGKCTQKKNVCKKCDNYNCLYYLPNNLIYTIRLTT